MQEADDIDPRDAYSNPPGELASRLLAKASPKRRFSHRDGDFFAISECNLTIYSFFTFLNAFSSLRDQPSFDGWTPATDPWCSYRRTCTLSRETPRANEQLRKTPGWNWASITWHREISVNELQVLELPFLDYHQCALDQNEFYQPK